jgi:hypothetical protein
MDTPFLTPLGLLFLLFTSDQLTKQICVQEGPMNIPTKFDSNWPNRFREVD